MDTISDHEILVVGCGIAGLAAANRADELGHDIGVLEKATKKHRGGQTRFSESFRVPLTEADLKRYGYEFATPDYSPDDLYDNIMKQTNGRAHPGLTRTLVDNAAVDEPPFYGYSVTGGIAFSFGGVAYDTCSRALNTVGRLLPGLYVAGNTVGSLFFDNYPGGTGLSNAVIYGKIAAEEVAEYVEGV